MNTKGQAGPLARAIAQQSSEWLEAAYPNVYDALGQELEAGHTLNDVKRILRRIFGNELRDAFVLRVLQAAEFMFSEQISVAR
jgi:hypothetical protein